MTSEVRTKKMEEPLIPVFLVLFSILCCSKPDGSSERIDSLSLSVYMCLFSDYKHLPHMRLTCVRHMRRPCLKKKKPRPRSAAFFFGFFFKLFFQATVLEVQELKVTHTTWPGMISPLPSPSELVQYSGISTVF